MSNTYNKTTNKNSKKQDETSQSAKHSQNAARTSGTDKRGNTKSDKLSQNSNQKGLDRSKSNKYHNSDQQSKASFSGYIIPIILVVAVLPLIMSMKDYNAKLAQYTWFENNNNRVDFFLYYKQWFLIIVAVLMTALIAYVGIKNRYKKPFQLHYSFIPLAIYALLALLSSLLSEYKYFSFLGSMDQFESIFALLSYGILVFYASQFVKTEKDVKVIMKGLLISVIILGAIGLSQYLGHDFFATEKGTRLITSNKIGKGGLNFVFGENRVYLTLFNPNYVGVYTAMISPIILVLLLFSKKLIDSLLYLLALVGLIICTAGSFSLAGALGTGVAIIGILIVMWKYLLKRFYITIPVFLILLATVLLVNKQMDGLIISRLKQAIQIEKTERTLTEIVTGDDKVSFTYAGNQIHISLVEDFGDIISYKFEVKDGNEQDIPITFDEPSGSYIVQDQRFPGFSLMQIIQDNYISFKVNIDGRGWVFTNQSGDNTYYLYNRFNKWDKIYNHPVNILTGYEHLVSNRVYLWSRTVPMVKDYILLGSGPDTYTMAFPQNDYLGFYNYGYESQIITKPHSLYFQIAIQTGLLSLIAFLAFYAMYFFSSLSLYLRGRFPSYYAKVGVAIMIGTFAYMVTGLTNDSSITTAPVFWTLVGIGLAVNRKAKPIILEEVARTKAERKMKKATAKSSPNETEEGSSNQESIV